MTTDEFNAQAGRFRIEQAIEEDDVRWLLRDTETGAILGYDGGEPEDQLLVRDWAWVSVALNAVEAERAAITADRDALRGLLADCGEVLSWDLPRDQFRPAADRLVVRIVAALREGKS